MLTGQRNQLAMQLHGAMLRLDELAGKLQNSELQAQHFAQRYQTEKSLSSQLILTAAAMMTLDIAAYCSYWTIAVRKAEQIGDFVVSTYQLPA